MTARIHLSHLPPPAVPTSGGSKAASLGVVPKLSTNTKHLGLEGMDGEFLHVKNIRAGKGIWGNDGTAL